MLHRFGNTEIHQPDAHTCGKQHRNPRKERIIGFAFVSSQPDIAVFTEHQVKQENDENRYRPDINIVEIDKNKLLDGIEQVFCKLRVNSR